MAKLRVYAKRPAPLNLPDLNITTINNVTVPFEIQIYQQWDTNPPEQLYKRLFEPKTTAPSPPLPTGNIIWDSLRDGKWDQKRVVDDSFGNIGANGKGFHMRASGDPRLDIKGNNEAWLICKPGHGRMYGACNNFNARLELEFAFLNNGVDNLSLKLRSRHQMGGAPENRFGGLGASISLTDVGFKVEDYHNVHSNSSSDDLAEKLKTNTWYGCHYSVMNTPDNKAIEFDVGIDYKDGQGLRNVISGTVNKPKASWMDKAKFDEHSEFWIRQNNEEDGIIGLRNVKLIAL